MKHLAITLMLCTMAAAAQAEGDRSSLVSCGIQFGNTQFSYAPSAETRSGEVKQFRDQRLQFVAGAARTESLKFTPPRPAELGTTEQRLPRKFTFATIGCSWR